MKCDFIFNIPVYIFIYTKIFIIRCNNLAIRISTKSQLGCNFSRWKQNDDELVQPFYIGEIDDNEAIADTIVYLIKCLKINMVRLVYSS